MRFLFTGVDKTIGQHQTAFRIGVHDFNGFAIFVGDDVTKLQRTAGNHVFRAA
ncbi:Uncharacterised protein [Vibrio cholerae]|nr:Uncharacterised protein [Vibrio cholerae]